MRAGDKKRKIAGEIREMWGILKLWKSSCVKVCVEHPKFYAIIGSETDLPNCSFMR